MNYRYKHKMKHKIAVFYPNYNLLKLNWMPYSMP